MLGILGINSDMNMEGAGKYVLGVPWTFLALSWYLLGTSWSGTAKPLKLDLLCMRASRDMGKRDEDDDPFIHRSLKLRYPVIAADDYRMR